MGNDQSQLSGIDIEDKAVEIADYWSQHSANLPKAKQLSNLTVFIGELFVSGPLWSVQTPLEKCSKNLMIYRHPCILKYISSWSKSSKFYLAVEHVKPLSHEYSSLNTLQLCLGLHSILKAICFLHEKATASHNNVCLSSVYVTDNGNWKLGGMEFACKYNDLSKEFLIKSKPNRYSAALDVNEEEYIQRADVSKEFVDTYAFFVLASELLKSHISNEIPSLEDFKSLCQCTLGTVNVTERPKLSDLLHHPFFNHDFIMIHSFLVELPLKSDEEKSVFFSNLSSILKQFNESAIASQLSGLLLSRMVLLNAAAQSELLPRILCFKQDRVCVSESGPLFSDKTFKKYISPRLLEIFCVRDAQIRLLLLKHFENYIYAFSEEELQSYILPELLVGIKDTNDVLVSVTLQALSKLVLILGANIVIGGKRAKLFTDGRPTTHSIHKLRQNSKQVSSIVPEQTLVGPEINTSTIPQLDQISINILPERQRPDGEEVDNSADDIEQSVDEELEWEDWEAHENISVQYTENRSDRDFLPVEHVNDKISGEILNSIKSNSKLDNSSGTLASKEKIFIHDIDELDIKNQRNTRPTEDIDFFQDMEPEIKSSTKFVIESEPEKEKNSTSKLNLVVSECDQEDGWGEEDWG
ncbi:hypothetical protein WA026_007266 [Henosepilachna vigintioctopunctata]|uniref:Protein kinase domain-containing protein n=1 Tax=Henosepilachna vigintioctopunctata TaxID=420089 RepID=A0AAW1UMW7_9CUCU